MSGILISCPKCGSGLRLKDRSYLGKLGRCPKCANRFLLEEPDEIELELADASGPSTGTAAKWVPDPDGSASLSAGSSNRGQTSFAASGDEELGFPIITEPAASEGIRITTHPTITVGMTFKEVTKLLGKPAKRKRMSELAAKAKKQGKTLDLPADAAAREYMVFPHAAGTYKLIFGEEKVVEIHSQPDAEAGKASSPLVPSKSRRSRKNKWIGIGLGGVLAAALVGVLIYASQVKAPPEVVERPQKKPPQLNQTVIADTAALEENVNFAKKFTEENFATQGGPITFERIPPGANIIIHLRPAELWSDDSKFAQFRATLTSDVTTWMEAAIKRHCLFEPKEIEEALICVLLGGRGEPPEIATRIKLTAPRKKSEFLTIFGGSPNNDFGYPVYEDGQRAFLVERDSQTFALAPARMAEDIVRAKKQTPVTDQGIESIVAHTDKDRHVTVIFQPYDARMHQEFLVAEKVQPAWNQVLEWLNVDDVETLLWSMHLGDEQFFSQFLLRPNSQANRQWTPALLEKTLRKKLAALPPELYAAVRRMTPQRLGFRKIIGRFPAMMQVYALSTLGGTGEGMAQFTTVLPAKAAPNLALGSMLVWDESTRTDFTKAPPKPQTSDPKLPDLIVDRLKLPMEVDFRRRPLQDAFSDIGEATHVQFEIDGEALKAAGYTKNMAQSFNLGEVPASKAIAKILKEYDKMCACITDEEKNIVTVMTFDVAKQQGLTPLKFGD